MIWMYIIEARGADPSPAHQTWARMEEERLEAMKRPLASSPDTRPSLSLSMPSKYLSYLALASAFTTHSWRDRERGGEREREMERERGTCTNAMHNLDKRFWTYSNT